MNNQKYRRGEVWYKVDDVDFSSRVQSKSRPVIIFSSDDGNASSELVNVIPLTLENKPNIAINVTFYDYQKRRQTALCNMLAPCDKSKLTKYLFKISDSTMERIEHAVLIANEMTKYIDENNQKSDLFKLFIQFKSLIDAMMIQKFEELMSQNRDTLENMIDDKLNKFRDELSKSDTYNSNLNKTETSKGYSVANKKTSNSVSNQTQTALKKVSNTMRDALMNAGLISNDASEGSELSKDTDEKKDKTRKLNLEKRSKRNVWDIPKCKEFIKDKDVLTASKMMEKYNLKSVSQVSAYYSYCRTKLNKAGINYEGK